jgi:serine/threonine protein kinase
MSNARRATLPPTIEGLDAVRLLGSGGFADVFLYRDLRLARDVAVKVMLPETLQTDGPEQFTREAHLMAKVSEHPYVVQIFQVGIAADGRPYLAMEFYPGPDFMKRCRTERFTVAEALRVGVQVAGAVETAHRAGILHRDLKPANILTSKAGWPGLSDFGIAANVATGAESGGLSIPWSPPEAFVDGAGDERSDVWSLAATVYTLLAGRSPFEQPGGSNRNLDLMDRIERSPLPPVGRSDVPASFERVLGLAMQKDPARRPATAAAFGQLLQEVEQGLRLAETQLVLLDTGPTTAARRRTDHDEADATRIKAPITIEAQPAAPASSGLIDVVPAGPQAGAVSPGRAAPSSRPAAPSLPEPPVEDTVLRPRGTGAAPAVAPARSSNRVLVLVGAVLGVVVLVAVAVVLLGGGESQPASTVGTFPSTSMVAFESIDPPAGLTATRAGADAVTFTWTAPDPKPGDQFVWRRTDRTGSARELTATNSVTLNGLAASERPCLEVAVRRSNGRTSPVVQGCAP